MRGADRREFIPRLAFQFYVSNLKNVSNTTRETVWPKKAELNSQSMRDLVEKEWRGIKGIVMDKADLTDEQFEEKTFIELIGRQEIFLVFFLFHY